MKKQTKLIDATFTLEAASLEIPSGRAVCRFCGKRINKTDRSVSFFFSLTDGGSYNPWTAVNGHAHEACTYNSHLPVSHFTFSTHGREYAVRKSERNGKSAQ